MVSRNLHALLLLAFLPITLDTTLAQNVPSPTLGGTQLWTDHFVHGTWRIQQHAATGHFRLLDDRNIRRAWGTYGDCRARFDELLREQPIAPMKTTAVVLLHGLGRTRNAMQRLADYLAEHEDWTAINFSYASTRCTVAEHAQALAHVVARLDGVQEVHLVGHSLGNIIIRHYLADREASGDLQGMPPRIGRVVMLAPPNQGSAVARVLERNKLFVWLAGQSGQQLGAAWDELQPKLATPRQFGIIAGDTDHLAVANPLLPGEGDLVVLVEETRLAGAHDFLVVPASHTFIMNHPEVQQATRSFLRHGHFLSEASRSPILPAAGSH